MKYLFLLLSFTAIVNVEAQLHFTVIDSYTLEGISAFSLTGDSKKITFRKEGSHFWIDDLHKKDWITIQAYGFEKQSFTGGKADPAATIFMKPDENLLRAYHAQYDFYARPTNTDSLFHYMDEPAEFPGGSTKLKQFLAENVLYPQEAIDLGVQGKVYVQLIIEIDGTISDIRILKGVNLFMDKECVRVFGLMPKWKPGMTDGKPVRSIFNVPVNFLLD